MFEAVIAGSLPKPSWLSETEKLWPQWKLQGQDLSQAKMDATLMWVKLQEDAGLDIVGDGEQGFQLASCHGVARAHLIQKRVSLLRRQ